MLLSAVIHLKAIEKGSVPVDLGPALRAEFLKWVEEADSKMAGEAHDGDAMRPYTVSDLKGSFRAQHGFHQVEAGQSAWFRLTSLREAETRLLLESVLPKAEGRNISLGRVRFQVQKVARQAGEHPWARQSSCQALVDQYFKSSEQPSDALEVEFVSPTTFHSDVHVPLPLPELVWGSWLDRWNKFSSASLPRKAGELGQARLALSRYKLETRAVHYDKATWIGFAGNCRFRILSEDEFWVRLCNLLADFAFFCGTGAKTSFGMGQTRVVNNLEQSRF
jgi:CRISPR-associated endoribonuclease Cas6